MMLRFKVDRVKAINTFIKLLGEYLCSQNDMIDLSKVNLLIKLEEHDIDVKSTKQEIHDILVCKLKEESFYQQLEDIIDSLEEIEEYKNIRQEEDIIETLETLKTFQSDIIDIDNMRYYKSYSEYFMSITEELLFNLDERYNSLIICWESIIKLKAKVEAKAKLKKEYGVEL